MAQRGPYAKTPARREAILATALEVVAKVGYDKTTVRQLAEAVGMSTTGLLHHFGSKEALFAEILRRRDELDTTDPEGHSLLSEHQPDLVKGLADVVRRNAEVPGLVQLYTRVSAEASVPGHPAHDYFRQRYAAARVAYTEALREAQVAGSLSSAIDADQLATILIALLDGLQSQWIYDPELDMSAHVASLLRALSPGDPA